MVKRKTALKIRKAHRYLGLFLGVQFLMWTISGMYFSWTDIDEIHGDQFKKENPEQAAFKSKLQAFFAPILSEITLAVDGKL